MKKNQNIDIVAYICICGLVFAMFVLTVFINKVDAKLIEQRQKLNDTMIIVDMLSNDIAEFSTELDILKQMQVQMQTDIEAMAVAVTEMEAEEVSYTHEINYDYDYVLRVVAAESRGESLEGQMAVAQCIRETANATGMTPEQVVKQVSASGVRQYTTPVDISLVTDSVREACERIFINGESVVDEPIRYFYCIRNGGYSSWHENSLTYVITIGNHKFFKK